MLVYLYMDKMGVGKHILYLEANVKMMKVFKLINHSNYFYKK